MHKRSIKDEQQRLLEALIKVGPQDQDWLNEFVFGRYPWFSMTDVEAAFKLMPKWELVLIDRAVALS